MFGQPPNTPFGGGGGFGQQQQQTNTAPTFGAPPSAPPSGGTLFGQQPAPAPTGAFGTAFGGGGGGGFGSPPPAPAAVPFGAPPAPPATGFGAPAPGIFGQSAQPAPGTFGGAPAGGGGIFGGGGGSTTTPAFGAPAPLFGGAPAPSTSPFAAQPQPAPAPTFGGFGASSTTPTPAFGAPPAGSLFSGGGGTQPAPGGPFGAPAPAPATAFGAPAAPAGGGSIFGGATTTSTPAPAFGGAPAPAFGGGFGSPAAAGGAGGGTRAVPYQVTSRSDAGVTMNLQSITAMSQYESKSFEELRFEDYSQGNRGSSTPTASNTTAFSGFGAPAPAPTSTLFGTTQQPPSSGGLFAPAPATAFGAPAPTTGGLFAPAPAPTFGAPAPGFGAPAPSPGGLFAPAPTPFGAPAPSPFGAPAPAPAFGAPASAFGGFGSSPAPAPTFGTAPAPSTGTSLFGAPSPAPAQFGSTPAPAPGGIFGTTPAPAPGAFGGFGTTPAPAPAFGAPAPGGIFGQQPAPAPGFGATPTSGSIFGQQPAPAPAFGGFGAAPGPFGSPAPAPFGAPTPQATPVPPQAQALFPPNAQIIAPAAKELLEQRLRAMDNERKELEKMEVWRGGSPGRSPASTPTSLHDPDSFFSPSSRSAVVPYTPRSGAKIRPRGFPRSEPAKTATLPTSATRRDNSSLMSPEGHVRSSQLNLIIRPDSLKKARKSGLTLDSPEEGLRLPQETIDQLPTEDNDTPTARDSVPTTHPSPSPRETQDRTASASSTAGEPATSPGYEYYQKVIGDTDEGPSQSKTPTTNGSPVTRHELIPKLAKQGYQVSPSVEEMSTMSEADLACVQNFSVKRPGYGMVEWEGSVDVRAADLDRIVVIEKQDVSVYTQDEEEGTKPDEGSKLNRPAKITFFGVFPKNGGARASAEEKKKFADKVKRITQKIGAEFISYEDVTGVWKIRVLHFSRYGLLDEDSDEENALEPNTTATEESHSPQFKPLATRKATPYKPSRIAFDDMEMSEFSDDDMVYTDFSEKETMDTVRIEAEEAANEILQMQYDDSASRKRRQPVAYDDFTYSVDGEDDVVSSDGSYEAVEVTTIDDFVLASSMDSFCNRLVSESDAKTSQVDKGLCLGRSYRVGWLPDGSFLKLGVTPVSSSARLVKTRPVLSKGFSKKATSSFVESQITHSLRCASGLDGCPLYSLPRRLGRDASMFSNKEKVNDALTSFASVECPYEDAKYTFTLVSNLLNGDDDCSDMDQDVPLEARRLAAVYRLLADLCTPVCTTATNSLRTKALSAIFAALSSGHIEMACELAADAGFMHLSVIMATSSEGRKDIMRFLLEVAGSGDTLRILEYVGGDAKIENNLFRGGDKSLDWRRRLVMRVLQDIDKTLPETMQRYENDVASGDVPFPRPIYLSDSSSQTKSTFYRLLQLCCADASVTLREAVEPSGFTPYLHDFQLPFHLVSAISAATLSSDSSFTLSKFDSEYVVDGYATQLTLCGYWEWAVCVLLSSIGSESLELYRSKTERAKALVTRHYTERDNLRRDLLERRVGVPSKWFEEALCYRAANSGDALKCCDHALAFDSQLAHTLFAEVVLPNLYFSDKARCKAWLAETSPTAPVGSLSLTMHDYFSVEDRLTSCASHPEEIAEFAELEIDLDGLMEEFSSLDDFLRIRSMASRQDYSLTIVPALEKNVKLVSVVSEVLARLKFLKVQLECLASQVE